MLFNLKISEARTMIDSNTTDIDGLLANVEKLRNNNKQLEDYLQQLKSAETAAESALEQLKNAYLMLNAVDQSQMDVLKQEVDKLYMQVKTGNMNPPESLSSNDSPKVKKSSHNKNTKKTPSTKESKDNSDAKRVEVEVVEEVDNSYYQTVMKLQKLIS